MATSRIYEVSDSEVNDCLLVEATSAAQALRYVATKRYKVDVPSPKRVAQLMGEGARLHTAGEETEKAGA